MIFSPGIVPAWVTDTLGWPTGRGVRVGVIGSGYDNDLPDPRVAQGISFVDPSDDFEELRTADDHDRIGYGTACARLILRLAPDAQVVPIRIYGEALESSPGTLHSAILWAVEERLDVVCVCAALQYPETIHSIYAACEKGRQNGMILVSGGKPEGKHTDLAVFEPVIGVVQGDFDSPYDFHFDPDVPYEVRAWNRGEVIGPDGTRAPKVSPDFSAAVVAGIVALLRQRFPGASIERIRELLQRFAM
jgi:hypothetical protein